jgi:4-diphosphocytidyl-2-C-methyl-D-erythritol kinase
MPPISETAYAKINLALHVRRRREDGYHELETLFAFADDGDHLSGELADEISLTIAGPFGAGLSEVDNLVVRAAQALKARFGVKHGAALALDKRLPVASGIGGGSADAAATARLLNRLWGIGASDEALAKLLTPLGADIPACVQSRTVYGTGIGTQLQAVTDEDIAGRAVLLVNPMVRLSTGPVFGAWDGKDRGALNYTDPWQATLDGRNDLEAPAVSICPVIADVLQQLRHTEADLVRMSGSGGTCYALYSSNSARDRAQLDIGIACPDWWTMASLLR